MERFIDRKTQESCLGEEEDCIGIRIPACFSRIRNTRNVLDIRCSRRFCLNEKRMFLLRFSGKKGEEKACRIPRRPFESASWSVPVEKKVGTAKYLPAIPGCRVKYCNRCFLSVLRYDGNLVLLRERKEFLPTFERGERFLRVLRSRKEYIPKFSRNAAPDRNFLGPGAESGRRNGKCMLSRENAFDVVGAVEAIAVGGYGFSVDMYVEILRGVRLNGDGSGVYENAPFETVAVSHEKKHDDGSCHDECECERPEKHAPTNRTHRKIDRVEYFYNIYSEPFLQALTRRVARCTLWVRSGTLICF